MAVKFFLKRAEYDREEELLRNSSLVQVIDPGSVTRLISNFDGSFRAPNGYIYPPCIAMPCGQCLTQLLEDRSLSHADVRALHHCSLDCIQAPPLLEVSPPCHALDLVEGSCEPLQQRRKPLHSKRAEALQHTSLCVTRHMHAGGSDAGECGQHGG